VVSKKVAKSAVARNTLKRRALSIVRRYLQPGRSFVLYARAGSPSLPYAGLERELAALLDSIAAV
jgi:ribonuclease P protein component